MDYLERRNDRFVFFVFRPRWSARAHRITLQQVHIVSSLSSSMHCCIALHCNPLFRWSAGNKKTSFTRCLEMQTLDIEKLFRGRSGPTNGYLSAYLMHPVMHGGPDGTLLMINLRCAPHHHTVDRLIVLYDAWHGALYRQPGTCSSIFFLSSKSLQKI